MQKRGQMRDMDGGYNEYVMCTEMCSKICERRIPEGRWFTIEKVERHEGVYEWVYRRSYLSLTLPCFQMRIIIGVAIAIIIVIIVVSIVKATHH